VSGSRTVRRQQNTQSTSGGTLGGTDQVPREARAPSGSETVRYQQNPRPTGGPVTFELRDDRLFVDNGRSVREARLDAVEQIRLSYDPRSFTHPAYRMTIRFRDGRSVRISSLSWKSLVEAERLDGPYRRLVSAVTERAGQLSPGARFEAGQPMAVWIAVVGLSLVSFFAIILFIWRALAADARAAALMGGLLVAIGLWQIVPMIRFNRPRPFSPSCPPADLLP
jgi:hypothetical protein